MILFVVDREKFKLEIWLAEGHPMRLESFPIAVGRIGHRTPRGVYTVGRKDPKPDWLAPDAEWVPVDMRGKIFHFDDPHNPFDGGFISLVGPEGPLFEGVGIHGTKFDPEVGSRASHGCVRMRVPDLTEVWKYADEGVPVVVV